MVKKETYYLCLEFRKGSKNSYVSLNFED
jgi:hypothetical protein